MDKTLDDGRKLYRKRHTPARDREFDDADTSTELGRGAARYAARRGNRSAAKALADRVRYEAGGDPPDNVSFGDAS